MCKRFARAYFSGEDVLGSGGNTQSSRDEINEVAEVDSEYYTTSTSTVAMGISSKCMKWVVGEAMIDTRPLLCHQVDFLSF